MRGRGKPIKEEAQRQARLFLIIIYAVRTVCFLEGIVPILSLSQKRFGAGCQGKSSSSLSSSKIMWSCSVK